MPSSSGSLDHSERYLARHRDNPPIINSALGLRHHSELHPAAAPRVHNPRGSLWLLLPLPLPLPLRCSQSPVLTLKGTYPPLLDHHTLHCTPPPRTRSLGLSSTDSFFRPGLPGCTHNPKPWWHSAEVLPQIIGPMSGTRNRKNPHVSSHVMTCQCAPSQFLSRRRCDSPSDQSRYFRDFGRPPHPVLHACHAHTRARRLHLVRGF